VKAAPISAVALAVLSNNTPLSAPSSVKRYRVTHHRAEAATGFKGSKVTVFGRPA
jgi:hypothetical protein